MKKEIKISKVFFTNILWSLVLAFFLTLTLEIIYGKFSTYYQMDNKAIWTGYTYKVYYTLTNETIYIGEMYPDGFVNKLSFWLEGLGYDYKIFLLIFTITILLLEIKRIFRFKLI